MRRRNQCEICGRRSLELFYTIKNLPVRMGVSDNISECKYLDLQYVACQNCKNVQILDLPGLSDVYETNHNINVIGKKWKDHNNRLSRFIANFIAQNAKMLEIGDHSAK